MIDCVQVMTAPAAILASLYELEVTSDIGDAMVELTQAQLLEMKAVFDLAITWAMLDSLLGNTMHYYAEKGQ